MRVGNVAIENADVESSSGHRCFCVVPSSGHRCFCVFFFVIVIELYINGAKMISNVTRFECVSNYFDDKIDDNFFLSST